VANFPEIANRIKSGDHKAVVTRLTTGNQVTTPQDFFRTFTNVPIVAIGIFIFEMDAGNNLGFTVTVGGVTTTGFTSVITAGADTSINQLFYTYIAVDSNQQFGILVLLDTPMMPVSCPVKNVIIHANNAWLMELHAQSAMISIQPRDFL